MGPAQRVIGVVLVVPSAWTKTKLPQKAKDVLVDPVLLFIPSTRVLVCVVPATQLLQTSPPVSVALTSDKSFDVQEEAGGKFCATELSPKKNSNTML